MKFYFKTSIFIILGMFFAQDVVYKGAFPKKSVAVEKQLDEIKHAEVNSRIQKLKTED